MRNIESDIIKCVAELRESDSSVECIYVKYLEDMKNHEILEFSKQLLDELLDDKIEEIQKSFYENGSNSYDLGKNDPLGDGQSLWADDRIVELKELRLFIKNKIEYYSRENWEKENSYSNVRAFKWLGKNPKEQILKLHELLINTHPYFISENTDHLIFETAFSGEILKNPLNIEWMLKHGEDINKAALFYLLKQMNEANLISGISSKNNYRQLTYIFCGLNKKPLQNLKQSNPKNLPKYSKIIDEIVNKIVKTALPKQSMVK